MRVDILRLPSMVLKFSCLSLHNTGGDMQDYWWVPFLDMKFDSLESGQCLHIINHDEFKIQHFD